jgi:hypothetical protein
VGVSLIPLKHLQLHFIGLGIKFYLAIQRFIPSAAVQYLVAVFQLKLKSTKHLLTAKLQLLI